MKICSKCKKSKELEEFHKTKHSKDGHNHYCKECRKAISNSRYDYEYGRNQELKYKYGITLKDFLDLYNLQQGCCKICSKYMPIKGHHSGPHLDHCHTTGKIRGLLCKKCNTLLGQVNDNTLILKNAIKYLENDENKEES